MDHNYPFLRVDKLDQLHVFRIHLKMARIDTRLIDSERGIKIGDMVKGNVMRRVALSKDILVMKRHYEKVLEKSKSLTP